MIMKSYVKQFKRFREFGSLIVIESLLNLLHLPAQPEVLSLSHKDLVFGLDSKGSKESKALDSKESKDSRIMPS